MSAMTTSGAKPSTLGEFLGSVLPSETHGELCTSVIPAIIDGISDIAKKLRVSHTISAQGTANAFGDDQLNVDVASENIIREAIAKCPAVVTASSEEDPVERPARSASHGNHVNGALSEQYTVAFDPLDGSSIIAPNWTVGTIIGIWSGATALGQPPAEKQIAAVLGVYGPRTTAFIAIGVPRLDPRCFEVAIGEHGALDCEILRHKVQLQAPPFKTRYFAPANLRAAAEDERYMDLIRDFIQNKYTLRYSGGLVPDVVHALVKGHGIYLSPVTATSKAKLRRLYELFPIALIIKAAGGLSIDPEDGSDVLERPAKDTDERAGLVCGTEQEVLVVKKSLSMK